MSAEAVVRARGVAVARGPRTVLCEISLALAPGEFLALVGANGSGKSTLLRALAGIDRPSAGVLTWRGGPLPTGPRRPQRLGYVPQRELPSDFTVEELVTLGLGLDLAPAPPERRRVDEILARFRIAHLRHRRSRGLSGGELQRVVLARALVAGPELLVLDEPDSHLDPARKADLCGHLDALRGTTAIIVATHDLDLAARSDRVALLGEGRILACAPPATLLDSPALTRALGVRVRQLRDPRGGRPFLRIEASQPPDEEAPA